MKTFYGIYEEQENLSPGTTTRVNYLTNLGKWVVEEGSQKRINGQNCLQ